MFEFHRVLVHNLVQRCTCRIGRKATAEELFSLCHGVHELPCPVYRCSRDPVDREHDQIARREILVR